MNSSQQQNDSKESKSGYTKFQSRGGPHDLGDPDDLRIRKVEKEVLIPKKMREKAKAEKCVEEMTAFNNCCLDYDVLLVFKCRKENTAFKKCLETWYTNEDFRKECEQEYVKERTEFRRTGIRQKSRSRRANKDEENSQH